MACTCDYSYTCGECEALRIAEQARERIDAMYKYFPKLLEALAEQGIKLPEVPWQLKP